MPVDLIQGTLEQVGLRPEPVQPAIETLQGRGFHGLALLVDYGQYGLMAEVPRQGQCPEEMIQSRSMVPLGLYLQGADSKQLGCPLVGLYLDRYTYLPRVLHDP